LLYALTRNLRPDHVIEIGVFKGATTEAIARALQLNGHGIVHAVDPYRTEYLQALFSRWPAALARHLSFFSRDSVRFFDELRRGGGVRAALALVDGNHDYEFASFDIESAARIMVAGGFLAVDNVTQPGPFFALRDFLIRHPGWTECHGSIAQGADATKAYDPDRADLVILRAPRRRVLNERPWSTGQVRTVSSTIHGLRLGAKAGDGGGALHAQIIVRGFGARQAEVSANASLAVAGSVDAMLDLPLPSCLHVAGDFTHLTVECCLIWQGRDPLQLTRDPSIY
jgi:hypothetical protein